MTVPTASISSPEIEAALTVAIDPWLAHMRWRPDFAAWRERRLWQERHQAARVARVRALAPVADARVLDLGCGMGGLSVALKREGFAVWPVDFNGAYCQITQLRARRYDLDLPVVRAAGEALPYPDASFDVVVCWDVLEHVRSLPAVLAEIRRVLRPGGAALVTVTNRYGWRDQHYHLPLINWLPRPAARLIVSLAGRSKRGAFADRQRLDEMSYISWPAFVCLCRSLGFIVEDTRETTLRAGTLGALTGRRRALAALALRTGLARWIYPLYRFAFLGTFEVVVRPAEATP
jgi:ubiquinone/menaquinone biosynthesis C-methylase UbiE